MNPEFPPSYIVIVVDIVVVTLSLAGGLLIVRRWREAKQAGALDGLLLLCIGLWGHAALYAAELYYVFAEPAGPDMATAALPPIERYGWHIEVVSVFLLLGGFVICTLRLTAQMDRLRDEAARRRDAEQAARESEARLAQAAEVARLGYVIYDSRDDACIYCSEGLAAQHGLTPDEFIAKTSSLEGGMTLTHPDDRDAVRTMYRKARAGETTQMEYRILDKDGETRFVREIVKPIFDADGTVVREVAVSLDVTDQHKAEERLRLSHKMEAVGQLTGGIAHDFNNMLAVILGNLELLAEAGVPADQRRYIEAAIASCLKGRDLTRNLLSFARNADLEPTEVDLNGVAQRLSALLARTLPENIELECSLGAGLWRVRVDPGRAESALLNLIVNARDAMPKGGQLTVETANMRIDDDYIADRQEDVPPGRYVMIAVSDTGFGVAPENLDRIFDPYFSTKSLAENSGLGLAIVHGFMKQSGGAIRVYSEPDVGTTFKIYFPALAEPARPADASDAPPAPPAPSGTARALVVEDETEVRKVVTAILTQQGYSVVEAESGDSAAELFWSRGPFDIVLTDIVMPGTLQGPALAKRLRAEGADLPIIFLSGYPNEATVHGNGLRPEDIRLTKPVSRSELAAAVAKALAAARR